MSFDFQKSMTLYSRTRDERERDRRNGDGEGILQGGNTGIHGVRV